MTKVTLVDEPFSDFVSTCFDFVDSKYTRMCALVLFSCFYLLGNKYAGMCLLEQQLHVFVFVASKYAGRLPPVLFFDVFDLLAAIMMGCALW